MKIALYEITQEYLTALEALQEMDQLPQEVIEDTLEGLAGQLEMKALNVAAFFQNLEAEVAVMREYERKMAARRKRHENTIQRLKHYLMYNMVQSGITKIEGPEFSLQLRKSPPAVVIDDEDKISNEYLNYQITLDKASIKKAITAGKTVTGAHLKQGHTLVIK